MSTVTDTYGDDIIVQSDDDTIYVTIEMKDNPNAEADVALNFEQAVEFGEAFVASINDILSAEQRDQLDAIRTVLRTPANLFGATEQDERAGWNQDALLAAIEYNRQARFSYEKQSGPGGIIERRVLAPSELLYTQEGDPFVVGYDPDRDDVRAFRLDRIVGYVEVS